MHALRKVKLAEYITYFTFRLIKLVHFQSLVDYSDRIKPITEGVIFDPLQEVVHWKLVP